MARRRTTAAGYVEKKKTATEWQVLFVNQYGRIIRIPHVKWYAGLFVVVMVAVVTATICLSFFLLRESDANAALKASMEKTGERISSLVEEKDLLLARLVIMRNVMEEERPEVAADLFSEASPISEQSPEGAAGLEQERNASLLTDGMDDMIDTDSFPKTVDIRQFRVTRSPGDSLLSIQFQIHNTDETSEDNVSGRIFVVLEEAPDVNEERLVVPAVRLQDGIPARIDRGEYFSIARFRPVSLNARAAHPERLTRAVVMVFSPEGEMLYKNDFEIEVTVAPAGD